MKLTLPILLSVLSILPSQPQYAAKPAARPNDPKQSLERTSFQTGSAWDPAIDLRSDVVMCYGLPFTPQGIARIQDWRDQGYRAAVMSGVAWGSYQDYLYGRFDGVNHEDEAQTDRNGNKISHGGDVYYMSPGINFGKFLSAGVKHALDAGVESIFLEEPEFWVRAGWSQGFRREWKAYYHEDWVPPDSSPDAQYRASLLKYYLYRRALTQVFDFIREYNRQHGTHAKCYVATHSLINYASWGIVSPESSLAKVGADGYIAQIWTGTARTPNLYEGRERERTFETAFLEYGVMQDLSRTVGGRVWFLNDPVEDDPNHSWTDYRTNWQSTLTASLLWPDVWRYEVMPWPERVFHGRYPTTEPRERAAGESVVKETIPADYATELLTVINAQNNMKQSKISWDCGTRHVGVVVSDTMLFQRGGPTPSDPHLGSFYGLAMPLLKRGLPIEPVQLENAALPGALKPYRVLLMTFEGMKPMNPQDSAAIAAWVKAGGVLVFMDDDKDLYNQVRAWWNTAPETFSNSRQALFAQMGLSPGAAPGEFTVGSGHVIYRASSPAALSYQAEGGDQVRELVRRACSLAGLTYHETNYLALRRGPYVIAAGLEESLPGGAHVLSGHFVDLFDAHLPIRSDVALTPGSRYLLLDLDQAPERSPTIIAAACKTLGAQRLPGGGFRFYAEGPDETTASVLVRLSRQPRSLLLDNQPLPSEAAAWEPATRTLLIRFPNAASGHYVTLQ